MGKYYFLLCDNQSAHDGNFGIYQDDRENRPKIMWLQKPCYQKTQVNFRWSDEIFLSWGRIENIQSKKICLSSEIKPVSNSGVELAAEDKMLHFRKRADQCPLCIHIDPSVREGIAGVGISMKEQDDFKFIENKKRNCHMDNAHDYPKSSNRLSIIELAAPNMSYVFTSNIDYYVAFGSFALGEIIDINRLSTKPQKISFSNNHLEKYITFTEKNEFAIRDI